MLFLYFKLAATLQRSSSIRKSCCSIEVIELWTGDFREFLGPILLEIYGHFMGHFFEVFFYAFLWNFYGWFFYDFQRCFSSASFRIEVPLIWFPFSISNNGFLNSMHCKFQISVIWKLEKVKVSKTEKVDVVAYAAYLAYALSICTWFLTNQFWKIRQTSFFQLDFSNLIFQNSRTDG